MPVFLRHTNDFELWCVRRFQAASVARLVELSAGSALLWQK